MLLMYHRCPPRMKLKRRFGKVKVGRTSGLNYLCCFVSPSPVALRRLNSPDMATVCDYGLAVVERPPKNGAAVLAAGCVMSQGTLPQLHSC